MGFIAPPLRYAIFGMPPILPTGIAMSFELAAYGAACEFFTNCCQKDTYIYLTLISSMLLGRIVWGIARVVLTFAPDAKILHGQCSCPARSLTRFRIILHIVLVPLVVIALDRARLMLNE